MNYNTDMSKVNPNWKTAFLNALREGHTVGFAAQVAGVSRRYVYRQRERSRQFAREWEEALQDGLERLLEMARARAADKTDKASAYLLTFLIRVRLSALSHCDDNVDIV